MKGFQWSILIGLYRSLLASSFVLTLGLNSPTILFYNIQEVEPVTFFQKYGLFYLLRDYLFFAHALSLAILLVVISGRYIKISSILHFYIVASFIALCPIVDGGDHLAASLTLFIIPIAFFDPRTNHWHKTVKREHDWSSTISIAFYTLIRIQMMFVYLHAFVGKLFVEEWANGTAVYYWLTHEYFGVNDILVGVFTKILIIPWVVMFFSWGTLFLEFLFAGSILLEKRNKKRRIILFFAAISFHCLIIIFHGLVSFFLVMASGLMMYYFRPEDNLKSIFTKNKIKNALLLNFT